MNIGSVRANAKGILAGKVQTLTLDLNVALRAITRSNESMPSFDIFAQNVSGGYIAVGALWEKAARETGEVYYSGRIEDPSLPSPLYVAAFPQSDGSINIVWTRPSRAAATVTGARGTTETSADDLAGVPGFGSGGSDTGGDGLGESTAPASRRGRARTPETAE